MRSTAKRSQDRRATSDGDGQRPTDDADRLIGPFPRTAGAAIDETTVVADLLSGQGRDHVLIDVGAHHGSALAPFARRGWTVVACEPDPTNRERLVERFGSASNVTIDPRAISDASAEGVAFFSSEESTGISALHAFRDSHSEVASVDVTTVTELIDTHAIEEIDFLKIDVEGYDWNVLKGVPWERVSPRVIECEFEDAKTVRLGHTYREVADYLVEHGYAVYLSEWHPIVRYGIKHQWRQLIRYPGQLATSKAWGNVLAFKSDPGPELVSTSFRNGLKVARPAADRPSAGSNGSAASASEAARADPKPKAVTDRQAARKSEPKDATDPRPRVEAPAEASSYDRIYAEIHNRSAVLFAVAQSAMWLGRKTRSYPRLSALLLALLATLATLAIVWSEYSVSNLLWAATAAVVILGALVLSVGYAGYLVKRAAHASQVQHNSSKRQLDRALREQKALREQMHAGQETATTIRAELNQHLGRLSESQKQARAALETAIGDLLRSASESRAAAGEQIDALRSELGARIDELDGDRSAVRTLRADVIQRLSQLADSQASTRASLEAAIGDLLQRAGESQAASVERIDQLSSELEARAAELGAASSTERTKLESAIAAVERRVSASERSAGEGLDDLRSELASRIDDLGAAGSTERAALESSISDLGRRSNASERSAGERLDALRSLLEANREQTAARLVELERRQSEAGSGLEAELSGRIGAAEAAHATAEDATQRAIEELQGEQALNRRKSDERIAALTAELRRIDETDRALEDLRNSTTTRLDTETERTRSERESVQADVDRRLGLLESSLERLRTDQASLDDSLPERLETIAATQLDLAEQVDRRLDDVESGLESAADSANGSDPVPVLRYPAPGSSLWQPVSDGGPAKAARGERRLSTRLSEAAGVQLIAQSSILPVAIGSGDEPVGVSSLTEKPGLGPHSVRWIIDAGQERSGTLGVLMALKSSGRRFVELGFDEDGPVAIARFDLYSARLIGGSGPTELRAGIRRAADDWRLCFVDVPAAAMRSPSIRLGLAETPEFIAEHDGDPKSGVVASEPVAAQLVADRG